MGDAADDARDQEEAWDDMRERHSTGKCFKDECPFCDDDFEPLFTFQNRPEKIETPKP